MKFQPICKLDLFHLLINYHQIDVGIQKFELACYRHQYEYSLPFVGNKICNVIWWMVNGMVDSLCTTYLVIFWCQMLAFTCCATSMIGICTNLFPIGCICCLSCICVGFVTTWCITYFKCFLNFFITTMTFLEIKKLYYETFCIIF